MEEDYSRKLKDFVRGIASVKPDIIALQEVNQSREGKIILHEHSSGYVPCVEDTVLREDNHLLRTAVMLREEGLSYHWTWLPIKLGYGKFDEGIGIMSLASIEETAVVTVSGIDDYSNWKTRKIVGIRIGDEWFYSVHYGWWEDEETFRSQWERTLRHLGEKPAVWLMGDFNNPTEIHGEGYELIVSSGFHDSFTSAECRDGGITVPQAIDGWRERGSLGDGLRMDMIFSSFPAKVKSSEVIFNDVNFPIVSDHFGVLTEVFYK